MEVFLRIFKFGLVGCIGIVIDFSITFLLKEKLKFPKLVANAIGFSLAVINNFLLNRVWTFNSNEDQILYQFSKFILVSVIGLLINTLVIYILNQKKGLNFYVSKIIAVGFVFIWNFTINFLFIFTK